MTHVPWHPEDMQQKGEELHGIESVELVSVGIDIGTTTTHLMFSRLLARRSGDEYSSKFRIVEREIVYQSDIHLTPYEDETTIDTDEIDELLVEMYDEAGYEPSDIDTGAVIVTGEASRKKNAEAIADLFSKRAGKFVCATAGANLESLMSAHGSGAVDHSVDEDEAVLHIDIGGGTTKLAYIVEGFVEETASINVGARLVEFDDGRVSKIEDAARDVADHLGIHLELGAELAQEDRERITDTFAQLLFELVREEPSELARSLMVTELPEYYDFDTLTFAGGGAEYVYDRNSGYYDDLGPELGQSIRDEVSDHDLSVAELESGIRATALGSNQHTVQVSGNTITISDHDLLPLRNVPMVPFVADHHDDLEAFVEKIEQKLELYDIDDLNQGFAFGFHLHGFPNHEFLNKIADASIAGWEQYAGDHPIILAFDEDVALNTGRIVGEKIDAPVIAVDGVELDQFGYIDVGEPLEDTGAVPLTVKSLLFEG